MFILFLGLALADPEAQYLYNYAPSYAYPVDASNVQVSYAIFFVHNTKRTYSILDISPFHNFFLNMIC